MRSIGISYIIITNGKKPDLLKFQIQSIRASSIPSVESEIIVCGDLEGVDCIDMHEVSFIPAEDAAKNGQLGLMRNLACQQAKYSNLVISDDDMIFPEDWQKKFVEADQNFDIMTTKVQLPDGTRFWDKACYQSPVRGHVILNYDEEDDFLYMSGGQSWIMKKYVFEKVQWDPDLKIYKMSNLRDYEQGKHNEDTDFSLRCRNAGFSIKHNPHMKVLHYDPTYTSIGRMCRRRSYNHNHRWASGMNFNGATLMQFYNILMKMGYEAEAVDILRRGKSLNDVSCSMKLDELEDINGGKLEDSIFKQ
jgi:hypothetical protein